MKPATQGPALLAINGGSSSIRFAFYDAGVPVRRVMEGKMDRIGLPRTHLAFNDLAGRRSGRVRIAGGDPRKAVGILLGWLERQPAFSRVAAIGHRIVHGMAHAKPARVTPRLLVELRRTAA